MNQYLSEDIPTSLPYEGRIRLCDCFEFPSVAQVRDPTSDSLIEVPHDKQLAIRVINSNVSPSNPLQIFIKLDEYGLLMEWDLSALIFRDLNLRVPDITAWRDRDTTAFGGWLAL